MTIKDDDYYYNDGTSARLLYADGTIPMTYAGARYNVPVKLYVDVEFPHAAPAAFVAPTRDMMIKANHSCVNADGRVMLARLMTWDPSRSRLRDVARALSVAFSEEPPLFTKPNPDAGQMRTNVTFTSGIRSGARAARDVAAGAASRVAANVAQRVPFSVRVERRTPSNSERRDEASTSTITSPRSEDVVHAKNLFRARAIASLTERLREETERRRSANLQSVELLLSQQTELYARKINLEQENAAMRTKCEHIEHAAIEMREATGVMQKWLATHSKGADEIDIDNVFKGADAWSQQLLEAHVRDKAIEDTLDALDDLLNDGLIHHADYMRQVMKLCKEQFYARAEIAIVTKMQAERGITNNAYIGDNAHNKQRTVTHGTVIHGHRIEPLSTMFAEPTFLQPSQPRTDFSANSRRTTWLD